MAEPDPPARPTRAPEAFPHAIPVMAEVATVGTRTVETGRTAIHKRVETHDQLVEVPLSTTDVEVERVRVDRPVEAPPPPRIEDGVWILSLVEEVLVTEKRLIVREELRIRTRVTERVARERVTLRREVVDVDDQEIGQPNAGASSPA